MKIVRRVSAALTLVVLVGIGHAAPPSPRQPVTVVLVHGALIDGSSWRGVYNRLTRDGYSVRIVQHPLTGLDADVKATQRVLDQIDTSVVLVGHSYGGAVITVAGDDPKVKALVYVAALQPDAGETAAEAAPPQPESGKNLRVSTDGFVSLDPSTFAQDFCADLPKDQAEFLARSQMPIAGAAFQARIQKAAWRDKPSFAVIATKDRALAQQDAERMAARAKSKVTLIDASHGVLISQPGAVAEVIEQAALGVK